MFFPSPGQLKVFRLPEQRVGVRIDTGSREGDTLTPFYEPMIAQVIGQGESRTQAIANAVAALKEICVEGIVTNRTFLMACLKHPGFVEGAVSTKFIDSDKNELLEAAGQVEAVAA